MLKKKIKYLAAMIAIVLVVAAVTSTDAKYVGEKSILFDMNLEVPYSGAIHEAIRAKIDGKSICETLIYDTNNVEVSYYYNNSNDWIIKMTTKRNSQPDGYDQKICIDPYFILNLSSENIMELGGYKIGDTTYKSLDTGKIKYMLVSYYIPATEVPERAIYNTVDYSVNDFNHLRVYTNTSVNLEKNGELFGTLRYAKFSNSFEAAEAAAGNGGKWVTEIIDLEAVNMRGVSLNNLGNANGYANWEGDLARLRFDLGQVGSFEAWFNGTTNHDCPEGKSIYIRNIMFFNSYYGAVRAQNNLAGLNNSIDPTGLAYSTPIEVDGGTIIPVTTLKEDPEYNFVDAANPAEDTVSDIF